MSRMFATTSPAAAPRWAGADRRVGVRDHDRVGARQMRVDVPGHLDGPVRVGPRNPRSRSRLSDPQEGDADAASQQDQPGREDRRPMPRDHMTGAEAALATSFTYELLLSRTSTRRVVAGEQRRSR